MVTIEIDGLDELEQEYNQMLHDTAMEAALILSKIGEGYVIESRSKGSYQDQTSNLRNANSYAVYLDGITLYSDFGRPETRAAFEEIRSPIGLELIVGNGMEYCSYVEGKGFNVVSSGFLKVMSEIEKEFG